MKTYTLTETEIVSLIIDFLCSKKDGNWHRETLKEPSLHEHGADIEISGGKRNSERFIIECKKKSYAKSSYSANHECWLNALGQLISRMSTSRIISKGKQKGNINRAYKYGLGLYWISAKVALKRIPHNVAKSLNLYIFSVDEYGYVKQFSPRDFGKEYDDSAFHFIEEQ